MHSSTSLLVIFLAVLPFISATHTGPRDASPRNEPPSDPVIVDQTQVPSTLDVYTYVGCREFPSALIETPLLAYSKPPGLTVGNCMAACNAHIPKYTKGGVGNNKCLCGNDDDSKCGTPTVIDDCRKSICPGSDQEYCGSGSTLAFYKMPLPS